MNFSHDDKLNEIASRVESGDRLSFDDGLALFATDDLPGLGKLADTARRKRHGRTTFFNVNRHLNPTNICYADCKFCGFFRTPRQPDAYTHNIEDSLKVAAQAVAEGAAVDPLDLVAAGGEDYELLATLGSDRLADARDQLAAAGIELTAIGTVSAGDGVTLSDRRGGAVRRPNGFDQRRSRPAPGAPS